MGQIRVQVEWKRIKHMYLKVGRDGAVTVSAPETMPLQQVKAFVRAKEGWLKKHLAQKEAMGDVPGPGTFGDGDRLALWGRMYRLKLQPFGGRIRIRADEEQGQIEICCRPGQKKDELEQAWKAWCRQQLAGEIPGLIRKWEPLMQVSVREWRIRDMKTRWGTCNMAKRRIWLNLQLVKWPKECLEQVVVHEMVHLLEPSHNKRFYDYMDKFLPQWKKWKERLEHNPGSIKPERNCEK